MVDHQEYQYITVKCPDCEHEFDQKLSIEATNNLNIEVESI